VTLFGFLAKLAVDLIAVAWSAAPYVAMAAGSMAIQSSQAKKAQSRSEKAGQALAEEQAKAAARARAVANAPISAVQMKKVMEQRELGSLVDKYATQDQRGQQIYTLPTAQPSSAVVRINNAIHDFITGTA
jgi:hypothetical protein